MIEMVRDLPDEAATARLGRALAPLLRPGDVVALGGDLGAGKTALARAVIRRLTTADEEVPSPTFTLLQIYETDDFSVWHFDLYRLERPDDALELDIDDAFAEGVSLIEWPERLGRLLPPSRLEITLSIAGPTGARRVEIAGPPEWAARIEELKRHV